LASCCGTGRPTRRNSVLEELSVKRVIYIGYVELLVTTETGILI